jgi:hypothetical protein
MRVRSKIWIAIIAACAALTVYEIPNFRLIWRYVQAVRRDKQDLKDRTVLESVLSDEIIATDPEAADILTCCLTDPNDEELATLVAEYPENEFFLGQLAYKLSEVKLVDPRALIALVDRLIKQSPDNAHYRYMKGSILLKSPLKSTREVDALEQFRQGNDLPDFTLPYSQYKKRVDQLCQQADIGLLDRRRVVPSETGWYWDIGTFLERSRGTYPDLSHDSFRSISAEVSEVADRVIKNAHTFGSLEAGCLLLLWAEGTRLRELDLSEEQAQQIRFRLARAKEINNALSQCYNEMFSVLFSLTKIGLVVALLTVLLLPASFPLVWLFLVIVNVLRGRSKDVSLGIKSPVLLIFGLAGFSGSLLLCGILSKQLDGRFFAGLAFVATATIMWVCLVLLARIPSLDRTRFERSRHWATRFCRMLWVLGAVAGAVACSFVLSGTIVSEWLMFGVVLIGWTVFCLLVWSVVAFKHHVFRIIRCTWLIRIRFVQIVFVLLLMTGMIALLRSVPVVPWVLAFITILLIGLLSVQKPDGLLISLRGVRHIFSRESEIVAARTKIARIMGIILVFCWVTILIGVHLSAPKWLRLDKLLTDPLLLYRPLPEANRKSYESVLSKKHAADPDAPVRPRFSEDGGLPEELHIASPEDLSAVIVERQAAGKPIRERLLLNLMRRCGQDVVPIIVGALKDPDALDVLMRRARWNDMSVKNQLEKFFDEKMTKLAETIAPIRSDPNSAESLIVRMRWGDESVEEELEQALEGKIVDLSKRVSTVENKSELRSELRMLSKMNSALSWSDLPAIEVSEYEFMMAEVEHMAPFGPSDPNTLMAMRKGDERNTRVRKLILDANMPELLEDDGGKNTSNPELLTSLLHIAGALAFVSEPEEAATRFSRLMDLVGESWDNSNRTTLRRSEIENSNGGIWEGKMWWHPCIFYRALKGVPRTGVKALLKEYVMSRKLADPFVEDEFADVLKRAGDMELAEWVFQKVAELPPTVQVSDYPDGIPIGRSFKPSEVRVTKRTENNSDHYLQPAFPYLGVDSIALLLEYLDSDNDQLRAFIVWRVTSLGYEWSEGQLVALRRDSFWKVRMNALFAFDRDDLAAFAEDENPLVRTVARILIDAETP